MEPMIGFLDPALEFVIGGGFQTTVVLSLVLGAVYFRKALGLGSILST